MKRIVLLLECLEGELCDFLLFAEIALVYNRLEESYVHDSKFGVTARILGELFLDLARCVDHGACGFLV